jgi:hypothetical protein
MLIKSLGPFCPREVRDALDGVLTSGLATGKLFGNNLRWTFGSLPPSSASTTAPSSPPQMRRHHQNQCRHLLIHKDNFRQGLVEVRAVLGNYNTLVPNTTDIRAQWDFPRVAGNGIVHDGDSSSGDRTYASLSVASLVSVMTQEDFNMVVAVDLTHRELTVPSTISAAQMTNYNHLSYAQVLQSVNPTLPQPSLIPLHDAQAEIIRLRFENARLQSIVATRPLLTSSLPTDSTSTSTITASAVVATVSVEQFQYLSNKYDSILLILQSLQQSPNPLITNSPMDITTNEKHGQRDVSSLVEQPDSKRLDSKVTPNKSHPVADAVMNQSP